MALTGVAGCERWARLLILQYVIEGRALQAGLHEAVDESTNQIGRYCEGKRGGWRRQGCVLDPSGNRCRDGANCQSTGAPRQSTDSAGLSSRMGKISLRAINRWLTGNSRIQTLASQRKVSRLADVAARDTISGF